MRSTEIGLVLAVVKYDKAKLGLDSKNPKLDRLGWSGRLRVKLTNRGNLPSEVYDRKHTAVGSLSSSKTSQTGPDLGKGLFV